MTTTRAAGLAALAAALGVGFFAGSAADTPPQPPAPSVTPPAEPTGPVNMVTVVDQTGGTWSGVAAAAISWDASAWVDVRMADQCDLAAFCVVIQYPTDYANRDWLGYWQPVSRHVSTVQLNTEHPAFASPKLQQWVVCHEVGHALGLGEQYDGDAACMRDTWEASDQPTTATPHDLQALDHVAQHGAPERTALAYIQG